MFDAFVAFVRELYGSDGFIPLHEPKFFGNEKQYVLDCIDSTFVSSVGQYVDRFEEIVAAYTGAQYAVATVNGTAALHMSLLLAGVGAGDEAITQPLSFVATCNAIAYCGAQPVFVDVDRDTLGLSPVSLADFLERHGEIRDGVCYNRSSGKRIAAVVPMHTFGIPCRIAEIAALCKEWQIPLVEDAAESLGSLHQSRHTGTFGLLAALSFNGNKVITTGGGGMLLTDDAALAQRAKHLTTTAKVAHAYEFVHDAVAYNYRLPNINAALGCAQMENLPALLASKAQVAARYAAFCAEHGMALLGAPAGSQPNHWLNAVLCHDKAERDAFLAATNTAGVMTRPIWRLLHELPMFVHCQRAALDNVEWLEQRVVNVPSSALL